MKSLVALLVLALPLAAVAADAPEPRGELRCRAVGVSAWLGVMFAPNAFHAAGLCRDQDTGAVYAMIESQAALGIGVGAGVSVISARSRIEIKRPEAFAHVLWQGDDGRSMKGGGAIVGASMGGCYDTFYQPGPCDTGERGLGVGLGGYMGLDRRGGAALTNYVLLRITPGMKWLKCPIEREAKPKEVPASPAQPTSEEEEIRTAL